MIRLLPGLCALALLLPTGSSAGPRFGIEGGGSLVWIENGYEYDSDQIKLEPRFDFNAAATVQFELTRTWDLTTGLRYSRLGNVDKSVVRTANEPYGNGQALDWVTRQEYLGVPVLVRLNFRDDRGPFLFGGAEFAWLIQAKVHDETFGGAQDITDRLKRYNATAVIGAGIELDLAGHGLEIAVRYGYGLVDFAEQNDLFGGHLKRKTRELALTVGFRL